MRKLVFAIFVMLLTLPLVAQENIDKEKEEDFKHSQIGALLAHTNLKEGGVNSESNRISVPSLTLFYNYRFNEKWALGLHTDFVTEQFIAESLDSDEKTIEREKPVAPAIMLAFKPWEHFAILAGGGIDIDGKETLALMRLDIEYSLEIKKGWEFVSSFGYDIRFNAYNSFQFGVGLAKGF